MLFLLILTSPVPVREKLMFFLGLTELVGYGMKAVKLLISPLFMGSRKAPPGDAVSIVFDGIGQLSCGSSSCWPAGLCLEPMVTIFFRDLSIIVQKWRRLTSVCLDRGGFTVILSACYTSYDIHSKAGR